MNLVTQHIRSDVGVSQVVKLRLEPSPAQVELLRGYCGTARAAYSTLLYQVRADLGQRAAEKTYAVTDADLTPAVSWHRFGLEKLLRENREQGLPWHAEVRYLVWDRSAHHLAAALARWKSGAARFPRVPQEARPRRRPSPGHVQGEGRCLAHRRRTGAGAGAVDGKASRARSSGRRWACEGAGGEGQPRPAGCEAGQGRSRAGAGGHVLVLRWVLVGVAANVGAAPRRDPADPPPVQPRASWVGVDAGMGRHFATLGQALPGASPSSRTSTRPCSCVGHWRTWPSTSASSS